MLFLAYECLCARLHNIQMFVLSVHKQKYSAKYKFYVDNINAY